MHEEILDFINRRFKENCHWLDGNCYYFALILKDRFPNGFIYYDVTYGHFMYEVNGRFYDWSGEIAPKGKIAPWKIFHLYDKVQYEVIMRDCVR